MNLLADTTLLQDFIARFGYWGIALIGLLPSVAFTVYVKWDDHRQSKSHAKH